MARISKFLDEEVVLAAEEGIRKLGKSGLVSKKLHAILAAKKHGITKTAEFYFITKKSLIKWIKDVKHGSLEKLEIQAGRGRKLLISKEQELEIKGWIEKECNITITKLRQMIIDNMGITLSNATVHRIMQRLQFSYITPRPKHYKQNNILKDEFKKKSKQREA